MRKKRESGDQDRILRESLPTKKKSEQNQTFSFDEEYL